MIDVDGDQSTNDTVLLMANGASGGVEINANTPRWRTKSSNQSGHPVIGKAPTGHSIHGLELIAFHRSGVGVNVIFVDGKGIPYGWPFE